MKHQKEIIKRIKSGEPHITYFPDNKDVYRTGAGEAMEIDYHIADLEDIAGHGIAQLELISILLFRLVDKLKAMHDSYGAVENLINPEK